MRDQEIEFQHGGSADADPRRNRGGPWGLARLWGAGLSSCQRHLAGHSIAPIARDYGYSKTLQTLDKMMANDRSDRNFFSKFLEIIAIIYP